ncbi:MAG: tRNA pseudouridine(55) synthase TruB [Candidatus Harrisonbacteria bacterium CG10_big_fil_rev_8_21_14_0_10_42_17]|uniref:tRNA pseudouridine synthase B n=1 Tax=Candidatus Harrisonbacteria bacterium CG10_big_fil_rev_8_21_14_0_10_42_17 TaxID=1974584 RepID=A0A2M6WHQ9_9BACT|nr:MAG: tRNA pseudouridine(55) synthase TruB [Candidatus Harrisonbacteria bacterium CG10_big_fil_rev_8_21_14_0_10_42_17]
MRKIDTKKNIILIDKPKGITSFDIIRKLRHTLNIKKMGHAGTLDPLATGLMIIGLRDGTKDLHRYIKLPKMYEAEILLGKRTTTGDLEGERIEEQEVQSIDNQELETVLEGMVGAITLQVPLFSAVKIKGKPLYKRARDGEDIEPPEKEMEVLWIKLHSHHSEGSYYVLNIELEVASGTYIRSIAEEIGKRLGVPATLKNLRRTKIGDFKIEDAYKF